MMLATLVITFPILPSGRGYPNLLWRAFTKGKTKQNGTAKDKVQ